MKTERMVLMISPVEKARISTQAAKLGVSASEYVRKLVNLLDADDLATMEELALLAPELEAMAERWEATFADFRERDAERQRQWEYRRTLEYHEKIRQDVLNDPTINWDAARALFGGVADAQGEAA